MDSLLLFIGPLAGWYNGDMLLPLLCLYLLSRVVLSFVFLWCSWIVDVVVGCAASFINSYKLYFFPFPSFSSFSSFFFFWLVTNTHPTANTNTMDFRTSTPYRCCVDGTSHTHTLVHCAIVFINFHTSTLLLGMTMVMNMMNFWLFFFFFWCLPHSIPTSLYISTFTALTYDDLSGLVSPSQDSFLQHETN